LDQMQGGIAQTIGLVLAANAQKRGLPTAKWPDGSIFNFCNRVKFEGRKSAGLFGFGRALNLDDPNRWLESIPDSFERAQLNVFSRSDLNVSDRECVGFANGGPVFVAQIVGNPVESWYGQWAVTDESSAARRIWSVTYNNIGGMSAQIDTKSNVVVRTALAEVLRDALEFNGRQNMGFERAFLAAQNALSDPSPHIDLYNRDMLPDGLLALESLQIFACATKAWVFGAMGSWNDVWFEGHEAETYRELSDRLFAAIIDGLMTATNSSGYGQ
jgi:YD repeat-containing protein